MKSIMNRLFGAGAMPEQLVALSNQPDVVLAEEGIPITIRAHGVRAPRLYISSSVTASVGSIVITRGFVGFVVGRHMVIHAPFSAQPPTPLHFTVADDGVHLHLDVTAACAGEGGSGTFDLHAKASVPPGLTSSVPPGPWHIPITPEGALILTRVFARGA